MKHYPVITFYVCATLALILGAAACSKSEDHVQYVKVPNPYRDDPKTGEREWVDPVYHCHYLILGAAADKVMSPRFINAHEVLCD